jgi:hypothetical protein
MNVKSRVPEKIQVLGVKIRRMNQFILVLPIWLVLGFSYFLRPENAEDGWLESEKNTEWEKMY